MAAAVKTSIEFASLGEGVYAVAVVDSGPNGEMDWAAYIGAARPGETMPETVRRIAKRGARLRRDIALSMFRGLPPDKWRP